MDSLIGEYGLTLGTFIVCFVSGFVPVVSAELFLIAVSATSSWDTMAAVTLAAAAGQMLSKLLTYFAGAGVVKLPLRRFQKGVEKYRKSVEEKWKRTPDMLIFASSFIGLPPLYVISILAGTLGVGWVRFTVIGFIGRLLRFAIVLAFPQLVKQWLGAG